MKFLRFARPLLFGLCVLATGAFSPTAHARRSYLRSYNTEAERVRWGNRNREFGKLWLSRAQNPEQAARGILPFALQKVEANADLRERAVVALGRIESPVAQKPLESLLQTTLQQLELRVQTARQQQAHKPIRIPPSEGQISPWSLKFALARIKSRSMRGTKRLDFMASSVGTTWPKVREQGRQWKRKLVDPRQRMAVYDYLSGSGSPRLALEEFAQLLHDMGQKGDDVKALGAMDLLVWPTGRTPNGGISAIYDPPQVVILTANMSREQAIDFWLKRALPPQTDGVQTAGSFSPQAFVDLGAPALKALKTTLAELLEQAKHDSRIGEGIGGIGPRTLFEAAAASGEPDFIPILQGFTHLKNGYLGDYAAQSLRKLKNGEGAAILPRPRLYFGPMS